MLRTLLLAAVATLAVSSAHARSPGKCPPDFDPKGDLLLTEQEAPIRHCHQLEAGCKQGKPGACTARDWSAKLIRQAPSE